MLEGFSLSGSLCAKAKRLLVPGIFPRTAVEFQSLGSSGVLRRKTLFQPLAKLPTGPTPQHAPSRQGGTAL